MVNPFLEQQDPADAEDKLIQQSLKGDLDALEKVIMRHQA